MNSIDAFDSVFAYREFDELNQLARDMNASVRSPAYHYSTMHPDPVKPFNPTSAANATMYGQIYDPQMNDVYASQNWVGRFPTTSDPYHESRRRRNNRHITTRPNHYDDQYESESIYDHAPSARQLQSQPRKNKSFGFTSSDINLIQFVLIVGIIIIVVLDIISHRGRD